MQITFDTLPLAISQLFDKLENIERLIAQKNIVNTKEQEEVLDIEQAAELLKLSKHTVYRLVSSSSLPVNKRGKRLYFSKQELTAWIKAGRRKTQTEIENEASTYFLSKTKKG